MHPKAFLERWSLTRAELAHLLNKKINTVDHWFSRTPQKPPTDVELRLDEIHAHLARWEQEEETLPQLRQLYELIRDRRSQ